METKFIQLIYYFVASMTNLSDSAAQLSEFPLIVVMNVIIKIHFNSFSTILIISLFLQPFYCNILRVKVQLP